jgi:hypothetical protein
MKTVKQAYDALTGALQLSPEKRAGLSSEDKRKYLALVLLALSGLVGTLPRMLSCLFTPDPKRNYLRVVIAIAGVLGIDEKTASDLVEKQFEASKLRFLPSADPKLN